MTVKDENDDARAQRASDDTVHGTEASSAPSRLREGGRQPVATWPALLPFWFLVGVSVAIILWTAAVDSWSAALRGEGLGAEVSSVLSHAAAALLILETHLRLGSLGRFWPIPTVVMLFALREADFSDWWFEPGVLEIELLSSPVPLWQKAISVTMMLLIAYTLLRAAWIGARPWLRGLRDRRSWAVVVMLGLVLIAVSQLLDHPAKTAERLGYVISEATVDAIVTVEELSELAMALSILLAACLYRRDRLGRRLPAAQGH